MRTFEQLEAGWQEGPKPPRGAGPVQMIVLRKGGGAHQVVGSGMLDCAHGLVGDRWTTSPPRKVDCQVTLMNALAAELVCDGQPLHMPGDNFVVDLDLSEEALPVGTRLRIGSALLEVTPEPHTGCKNFAARFGQDAMRWINWRDYRSRKLRGVNCRVIEGGTVNVGDVVGVAE